VRQQNQYVGQVVEETRKAKPTKDSPTKLMRSLAVVMIRHHALAATGLERFQKL
jgi:hypothetical protein